MISPNIMSCCASHVCAMLNSRGVHRRVVAYRVERPHVCLVQHHTGILAQCWVVKTLPQETSVRHKLDARVCCGTMLKPNLIPAQHQLEESKHSLTLRGHSHTNPTSSPRRDPITSATRCAAEMAAIRRGCVCEQSTDQQPSLYSITVRN